MQFPKRVLVVATTLTMFGCPAADSSDGDPDVLPTADTPATDNPTIADTPVSLDDPGASGGLACNVTNKGLPCLGSPNVHNLTGLQAYQAAMSSFQIQFNPVVWLGGMQGTGITRDGKTTDGGYSVTLPGGTTLPMTSGWIFSLCTMQGPASDTSKYDDDALSFETTSGTCTAMRQCASVNCNTVRVEPFPTLDSAAAIAAAFPDDPTDTLYLATLTNQQILTGKGTGFIWLIKRLTAAGQVDASKNVDAMTGAVTDVP